jgi:hypothetical protein
LYVGTTFNPYPFDYKSIFDDCKSFSDLCVVSKKKIYEYASDYYETLGEDLASKYIDKLDNITKKFF